MRIPRYLPTLTLTEQQQELEKLGIAPSESGLSETWMSFYNIDFAVPVTVDNKECCVVGSGGFQFTINLPIEEVEYFLEMSDVEYVKMLQEDE